jgi:arylsulfatase A-like enzyme
MKNRKVVRIAFISLGIVIVFLVLLSFLPLKISENLPWKARRLSLQAKDANIVLFTTDTLRADHLECYGYKKVETPQINRLAQEGVLFENVVCQTPLTLPSHSSIFTGTYPLFHGVRDNGGFYLDEKHVTLAECLKKDGFLTGAFVAAFVLDSRWGLDQGFDYCYDNFDLTKYKTISLDAVQRRGNEVLEEARRWLGENSQKRFFAWIHLYDPHTPYDPPEPFKSRYRAGPYSLYDGEIAYVDQLIGDFRGFLEEKGLLQSTLIVFTGDHGESLGEHKESAHGFFVYDAVIRVPLILRFPGPKGPRGKVIKPQVHSVDLMPTILDLVGEDVPSAVQGKSLLPLIRTKEKGDRAA